MTERPQTQPKPTPRARRRLFPGRRLRGGAERTALALALVAALGLSLTAAPALAGPPGGVPPGLAKKGVTPGEWQASKGRYGPGDRLPRGDYRVLSDYGRYGLPDPGRGYGYYVVDGQVLRVAEATLLVAAAVDAVGALLD